MVLSNQSTALTVMQRWSADRKICIAALTHCNVYFKNITAKRDISKSWLSHNKLFYFDIHIFKSTNNQLTLIFFFKLFGVQMSSFHKLARTFVFVNLFYLGLICLT